jgi:general secretion pathway protein G
MKSRRRRAGFTLIEMMVVIVIIGLVAAVAVVVLTGRAEKAKVETTKALIEQISQQIEQFKLNHNRYPDKLEDLLRKPADIDPKQWPPGGYLKKEPKDGWGRDFIYRVPGTNGMPYDVISLGDDGREGGDGVAADLWNHDAAKR